MRKNVTYRKIILISMFIITVSIIGICGIFMSYTPSIVTDKIELGKVEEEYAKDTITDRTIVIPKGNSGNNLPSVSNDNANLSGNISYEEFIVDKRLVALNTKPIPFLKYIKNPEKSGSEERAKRDATLELWEQTWEDTDKRERIVKTYKFGQIASNQQSFENQTSNPNYTPFNNIGKIWATSRTLATYNSTRVNLEPAEAWILAHDRSLSSSESISKKNNDYSMARIDKVQLAMWKLKNQTNYKENYPSENVVIDSAATNLYQEAKYMQDYSRKRKVLGENDVQDNKINEYEKGTAGIVTYDENTKEFLVGPFSIFYIRDVKEVNGGFSVTVDTENQNANLIVFSAITDANVYALVNGEEKLLNNWEFVYSDVTVKGDGSVERTAVLNANQAGDVTKNIYPYPNEEFYIKFDNPNNSIQAITKLEFELQNLNAVGTAYKLTGEYVNVDWKTTGGSSSVCTKEGEWIDEGKYVTKTRRIPEKNEDGSIKRDSEGNIIYKTKEDEEGNIVFEEEEYEEWVSNWKWYAAEYTYTYNYAIEDDDRNKEAAADLYSVINAQIYSQKTSYQLKVGTKNAGYEYSDYCIPLTMDIGGTVWIDGNEVGESQGKVDGINNGEEGKLGVTVKLYEINKGDAIARATTDDSGKYKFNYVPVGPKYYVEFEYDWMKYKSAKVLAAGDLADFTNNPGKYLSSSHAGETIAARKAFNQKFYEIGTDKSYTSSGNMSEDMSYTYNNYTAPYYQTATIQEFNKTVSTKDIGVILPMQTKYAILEGSEESKEAKFLTVGVGESGICALTSKDTETKESYKHETGNFLKIQTYLNNINLGLVERTPADFTIKSDVVTVTTTLNEVYSDQSMLDYNQKQESGFGMDQRTRDYYNIEYKYEVDSEAYGWRWDFANNSRSKSIDELQVYVLYKFSIKNESPLIDGYITELSNYYDKEYFYPVNNDEKSVNFYTNEADESVYKEKAMTFMQCPSYVMKDNSIIKQVRWTTDSKYEDKNLTNLNKMYTKSLEDILLKHGETMDIYTYFKVERKDEYKDTTTEYKYGKYLTLNNETKGKQNITEINAYRALDYVEKDKYNIPLEQVGGSRVDIDSNPGNIGASINVIDKYEDDIDEAPRWRLIKKDTNGKEISGYVWEDLRTEKIGNNQWVGNGQMDDNETRINNVLVELIRLEYNPATNSYDEVEFSKNYETYIKAENENIKKNFGVQYNAGEISLIKIKRRTGPQEESVDTISDSAAFIDTGQYRFRNLIESGQYKVRFLYGDETQLTSNLAGVKYNGHDYKSTEFAGFFGQNSINANLNTLNSAISTQIEILTTEQKYEGYAEKLKANATVTHKSILCNNTTTDLTFESINNTIDKFNIPNKDNKVLVILNGGELENIKDALQEALRDGIMVIVVNANQNIKAIDAKYRDKSIIYYDTLNLITTADTVYKRIVTNIIDEQVLKISNSQATDFIENTNTINGNVYGRIDVMKKSQTIDCNKAYELEVEDINKMISGTDKNNRLRKLAEYKMSAESYSISINSDDNDKAKTINLGLQRIPESSLELSKEVDDIIVELSNGQNLISYKNGSRKNVQFFENHSYNIYMDEEIMQGANIRVVYKITVHNTGEVDNLMSYLKYYPSEIQRDMYRKLTGIGITNNDSLNNELSKTIVSKVNKVYDYYDNLIFRAEDNNMQKVSVSNVKITTLSDKRKIPLRDGFGRIETEFKGDRNQYAVWSFINDKNKMSIVNTAKFQKTTYDAVVTEGLSNIEIYPYESTEVRDGNGVSAASIYLLLTKTLSAQDFDFKSALEYRNFAEIIETHSVNGRRDNKSSVGNFIPKDISENETDEADSDQAEIVKILVPFGIRRFIQYSVVVIILGVVAMGLNFLRIKVKKRRKII